MPDTTTAEKQGYRRSIRLHGAECPATETPELAQAQTSIDARDFVAGIVLETLDRVLDLQDQTHLEKWQLKAAPPGLDIPSAIKEVPQGVEPDAFVLEAVKYARTAPTTLVPVMAILTFAPWDVTNEDMFEFATVSDGSAAFGRASTLKSLSHCLSSRLRDSIKCEELQG